MTTNSTNEEIRAIVTDAVNDAVAEAMKSGMAQFASMFNDFAKQTDERFERIDERFERIDKRFDEIDKRFERIDERFDRVEARINRLEDSTRDNFDRVYSILDGIAARLDDDDVERVALGVQVTRLEDWVTQVAPVNGVGYTPGA